MRVTKSKPPSQAERARTQVQQQTRAMNEELVLSGLRQRELTQATDSANARLRVEITGHKQAEALLRASEERFRALFELGPVAVYSCDATGMIREFNRRAVELWGREPVPGDTDERFCGSFKLFRPDGTFMPHAQCPMADVVSGKRSAVNDAEVLIERPDGSRVIVVVNIRPLRNEQEEITGAINCFYDISERKRSEDALRESEERFHMVADNISQLAWTCDQLGNVTWYNQRWLDYTGLTFEEMRDWGWKKVHHPDHVDRVVASVTRSRESGEIWEDTFPLRRKDGEYHWFLSRALPIRDAQGNIVRWFGTNTDVTQQREAQNTLRQAQAQLADRAVQLEELVAERTAKLTMAHEQLLGEAVERKRLEGEIAKAVEAEQLRLGEELHDGLAQELTGASMILFTLEKQMAEASPTYAQKLREVQKMLLKTITQARNLANGFYPVELEKHGLGVALQQLAQRTQESFGVSCVVEAVQQPPKESKDAIAIQLFRVAQEAVHNATKHSRAAHILIRLTVEQNALQLTVRDDGVGLRPKRQQSGGMGMRIMQHRMGLIGGKLEVRNANGGGVVVSCAVPGSREGKE